MGQTNGLQVINVNSAYPSAAINRAIQSLYWYQVIEDVCNGDMSNNMYRENLTLGNVLVAHQCAVMYGEAAYGLCAQ